MQGIDQKTLVKDSMYLLLWRAEVVAMQGLFSEQFTNFPLPLNFSFAFHVSGCVWLLLYLQKLPRMLLKSQRRQRRKRSPSARKFRRKWRSAKGEGFPITCTESETMSLFWEFETALNTLAFGHGQQKLKILPKSVKYWQEFRWWFMIVCTCTQSAWANKQLISHCSCFVPPRMPRTFGSESSRQPSREWQRPKQKLKDQWSRWRQRSRYWWTQTCRSHWN